MTNSKALEIMIDHQKWRRGEAPYDKFPKRMRYTPKELGVALDVAKQALIHLISIDDMTRKTCMTREY